MWEPLFVSSRIQSKLHSPLKQKGKSPVTPVIIYAKSAKVLHYTHLDVNSQQTFDMIYLLHIDLKIDKKLHVQLSAKEKYILHPSPGYPESSVSIGSCPRSSCNNGASNKASQLPCPSQRPKHSACVRSAGTVGTEALKT